MPTSSDATTTVRRSSRGRTPPDVDALFHEFHRTRDRRLRNQLVELHLHLGEYFARRYARRHASEEDLRQLSMVAIILAVERFDPTVGVSFRTFASRTIEGECKRYLRDRSWTIRPPRRTQELYLQLRRAEEDLTHRLGRSPNLQEIAEQTGAAIDDLLEALEAGTVLTAASLDQGVGGGHDRDEATLGDLVAGGGERAYADVDHRAVVDRLLARLAPREREIVVLRYFEGLSQSEIADRVGVSQSYLSRVLRRTLRVLEARSDSAPPAG